MSTTGRRAAIDRFFVPIFKQILVSPRREGKCFFDATPKFLKGSRALSIVAIAANLKQNEEFRTTNMSAQKRKNMTADPKINRTQSGLILTPACCVLSGEPSDMVCSLQYHWNRIPSYDETRSATPLSGVKKSEQWKTGIFGYCCVEWRPFQKSATFPI